jgi:hypothetical protein
MNTYGDKGHVQGGWIIYNKKIPLNKTDIHTFIYQIYFQLVRTDNMTMLKYNWQQLLKIIFDDELCYIEEIALICKIILNTRDINFGKGERKLSYMLLLELYNVNKPLAKMLFDNFVKKLPNKTTIGSWKDVKRFSQYIIDETSDEQHEFITHMIELSNIYLRSDYKKIVDIYTLFKDKDQEKIKQYIQDNVELSLVAKWMPRKSRDNHKYGWLFNKLADNMHSHYFKTIYKNKGKIDYKKLKKAINKSEMEYRKTLSFVNKHLNVIETFQTSNQTSKIDFNKVPSKALQLYHNSFLNSNNVSIEKNKCRENYISYLKSNSHMYSNCYLYEIVKKIVKLKLWTKPNTNIDKQFAVKLWNSRKLRFTHMNNIALLDMSCSMNSIPLYNCIALGIFIAEHNTGEFHNKLMLFGNKPSWVSFDESMDICDKVRHIIENTNNVNSDLYSVFDILINIIKSHSLSKEKLKSVTTTILSDMQIDQNVNLKHHCLKNVIESMFLSANIDKPQLVFWNLKHTNGFPVFPMDNYEKILMFSGYSEKILYYFRSSNSNNTKDKNTHGCKYFLFNVLSDKRYEFINKEIVDILMN